MNTWCLVLCVGCAMLTASVQAGGVSTNLLSKAQLKLLDKNGNNIIDYKEIQTLPKAQADAALDAYDVNADGEITATELERVPRTKEDIAKEEKKQQQAAKKQETKKAEPKKAEPKKAEPKKPAAKPAPKPDPKKPVKK